MTKVYTIGEVARILDLSPKTLRHYDALGLLIPHYISPETGYRYFAYDQFFRIDVIRYLNKTMNIPLKEINLLLEDEKDTDRILTLLHRHQENLDKKIAALEYSKQLTVNMIQDVKNRRRSSDGVKIFEQYLMSRCFYYIDVNAPIEEIDIHAKRSLSQLKTADSRENNVMVMHFDIEPFLADGTLLIKGFGIFSEEKLPGLNSRFLQEGRYLTHRFLFSEDNARTALKDLLDFADHKQIKLSRNALVVSRMVDLTARDKYDYYMDLQILEEAGA